MKIFHIFGVSLILFNTLPAGYSVANNNMEKSLADNYTALTEDVKWFFRGIRKIAMTVEQLLPNDSTVSAAQTRTFSENTRLTFLLGVRHLLVGVREIAMTFEQSFNTDHIKQLHQLKNATNFVNELFTAIKLWFSQLRALVLQLAHVYNRYIPEVLFGKCLGTYLVTSYPERSYFEYPFILIAEIYSSIITTLEPQTEPPTTTTDLPTELSTTLDKDLNMEQNEIPHSYLNDYKTPYGLKSPRQLAVVSPTSSDESFFDFSSVLNEDKNEIIANAINQQSWQICFKLYTAESISRSLKFYFLGI